MEQQGGSSRLWSCGTQKVVFWLIIVLFYLWHGTLAFWCQCESIFLNASCEFTAPNHQRHGQRTFQIPEGWILYRKLSGWRLCSELNMIFIFHDNGDGDDDNAVCIVMLMRVPGVTGRRCVEAQHWCSPRWLWTFFCPSTSDWLMDRIRLTDRLCPSFTLSTYLHVSVNQFLIILFPNVFLASPCLLFPCLYTWCVLLRYFITVLFASGTSPYLYIFLSAPLINLSVCLCPIFQYLPAVILCFLSFICGSHQTLAPDWFSCEQGCSGGPGTSSLSFEAPSHPGHWFSDPPPSPTKHLLLPRQRQSLLLVHLAEISI